MKILLCHNYYQQPGGEDESFADEARLLESRGHEVIRFTRHNADISALGRWRVARETVWNGTARAELRALIHRERPALMHCTNTFPRLSPAVYWTARAASLPVVQSLRNYRMFCVNGLLMREGHLCEDCMGAWSPWRGVQHGCYRGDRGASAVVATMVGIHRAMRTWSEAVDVYFTPTEFARRKCVQAGLPAERVRVKPNFVSPDPGPGIGGGGYALFVGRLSPEKGVETLLAAWAELGGLLPLKIVGDGPLGDRVRAVARTQPGIEWLGHRPRHEVLSMLGEASCLVMPSVWYETFGRTIVEAFARGTPAFVSRLGAMAELVEDGRTGFHFAPGSSEDLAAKVRAWLAAPDEWSRLRTNARREFERRYTADANYAQLMAIYDHAIVRHRDAACAGARS
jgi:glycosyltransferase involved in cell wall biosynthesis